MKKRNPFEGLVYDGDWHTPLVSALKLAKESTCSTEILIAIYTLEQQLNSIDECIHTIDMTLDIPAGIDTEFQVQQLREGLNDDLVFMKLQSPSKIDLSIKARGSKEIAISKASDWVRRCLISTPPPTFPKLHLK